MFKTYQEALDWTIKVAAMNSTSFDLKYYYETTDERGLKHRHFSDNYTPLPAHRDDSLDAGDTWPFCSAWSQGSGEARIGPHGGHVIYGPDEVMPYVTKPLLDSAALNNCLQTQVDPNVFWRIGRLAVYDIHEVNDPVTGSHPAPSHKQCETESNPCNPASGNKLEIETDFNSNTPFGLSFTRTYNSMGSNRTALYQSDGWRHNYSAIMDQRGVPPLLHTVTRPSGAVYYFEFINGQWSSSYHQETSLQELSNGWLFIDENDIREEYNTTGQLVSMQHPSGWVKTLTYNLPLSQGGDDNSTTLDNVVGPFGRELTFQYNAGYLNQITTPDGDITYNTDVNGNLITVTYPDNKTRQYHYEDVSFPHHLTGITDENGDRISTWDYDNEGRAILSKHALDTEQVTFAYNPDGTTTVTNPLGGTHTYTFEPVKGSLKINDTVGERCVTCIRDPTIKSQTYTAGGYVASTTDWEDNQTTFSYNTRGLEQQRIEALGTPQQRKTITQWHPTYRVPTQIDVFDKDNNPLKRTTNTYDPGGVDLTKRLKASNANGKKDNQDDEPYKNTTNNLKCSAGSFPDAISRGGHTHHQHYLRSGHPANRYA